MFDTVKRFAGELVVFYLFLNISYFVLSFLSQFSLITRMEIVSVILLAVALFTLWFSRR